MKCYMLEDRLSLVDSDRDVVLSVDVRSTDPASGHRVQCSEIVDSHVCPVSGDLIISVAGAWNDHPVHPFNDETPTTWEWLVSVGGRSSEYPYSPVHFGEYKIDEVFRFLTCDGIPLFRISTRGRVRMAAKLFGIELKEGRECTSR